MENFIPDFMTPAPADRFEVTPFSKPAAGSAFIKLHADKLAAASHLNSQGSLMFFVLVSAMQSTKSDLLKLNFRIAQNHARKLGHDLKKKTYERGMEKLCEAGIIAKHVDAGEVFVNNCVVQNGTSKEPTQNNAPMPPVWHRNAVAAAQTQRARVAL